MAADLGQIRPESSSPSPDPRRFDWRWCFVGVPGDTARCCINDPLSIRPVYAFNTHPLRIAGAFEGALVAGKSAAFSSECVVPRARSHEHQGALTP